MAKTRHKFEVLEGFMATKEGITVKYRVELFDLGFYIYHYIDGKLHNMTTRNAHNKVNAFLEKRIGELRETGWEITASKQLKVKFDSSTLKYII